MSRDQVLTSSYSLIRRVDDSLARPHRKDLEESECAIKYKIEQRLANNEL